MNSHLIIALWCAHRDLCISVKSVASVCSKRSWPPRAIQVACLLPIDFLPTKVNIGGHRNKLYPYSAHSGQSKFFIQQTGTMSSSLLSHIRLLSNQHNARYATFWDVWKIYFTQLRNFDVGWSRAWGGNEVVLRFWQLLSKSVLNDGDLTFGCIL